ncbi:MAG: DUF58 domain-containing protein [Acidiferrobacterales bacterium]
MSITLRAYFFFAVICLVGIAGQWTVGTESYFWRILAVAFFVALVLERVLAKKWVMTLERELPQRAYLGRPLTYRLRIGNPSHRPIQIEAVEWYPDTAAASPKIMKKKISPGSVETESLTVTPTKLGNLTWDHLYCRVAGLLGLAHWNRRLSSKSTVTVVPDHLHLAETRVASQDSGDLNRRRYGSGLELIGLRDYQPGDSLRSIDWKATARSGRHTVRVFTEEQRLELTLLVDAGRRSALQAGTLTRLGHYVNVAARLAEKTILEGNTVNLVCFSDKLLGTVYQAKGRAGLLRVRAALEKLRSQETDSNMLPAVFEARSRARQRNLMVLLTDLDEASTDSQLLKATGLLVPKHLPLVASILDDDTVKLESRFAHSWLDPYTTMAAHESLLDSRRAALYLQRKGAHVVYARPANLDKEVMSYYRRLLERNKL